MEKCFECGKHIEHIFFLDGKAYGYSCYKKAIALKYKHFEECHNEIYDLKCFAIIQIFEGKKSSNFHDSICSQWHNCHKLTMKQFKAIENSFTGTEQVEYLLLLYSLLQSDKFADNEKAQDITKHIVDNIDLYAMKKQSTKLLMDDAFFEILSRKYPQGYHFVEEFEKGFYDNIRLYSNGKSITKKINGKRFIVGCKNDTLDYNKEEEKEGYCKILTVKMFRDIVPKI